MYKKTASDALQDYIDHFEGRSRRSRHYTRQVSDLLSPHPKFKFVDAVEKRLDGDMSTRSEGLLKWINQSYNDSLKSTCDPLYVQRTGKARKSRPTSNRIYQKEQKLNQNDDELSTLPSPQISDVEIDSDQDTVETDILVRSYHGREKGAPESAWVKDSNSMYPKWVDEVNQSASSYNDPRRSSSVSVLLKSTHDKSSPSRSMDASGLTMDDVSSVDTDVILETSIYGNRPVNMGGSLHQPLFDDDKVRKILSESRRKIKKNTSGSSARSGRGVSSRMSQSISSPQKSGDVIYSERILSKHRERMFNKYEPSGRYDKSKVDDGRDVPRLSNIHQDSKMEDRSRFIGSQSKSNVKGKERMRSSVRNLASSLPLNRPVMHLSVAAQNQRQNTPESRKSLKQRPFSSTSDFCGSSRATLIHTSKSTDLLDITSQRTSGYHSDALSPQYGKQLEYRNDAMVYRNHQSIRPSSSASRRIASTDKRATISRKDSNSTEILMRQPPTGTKVHQRSKTWGHLQSASATPPGASSTPMLQPGHRPRGDHSETALDWSMSGTSKPISDKGRVPPYSKPHSTADARVYSDHQAYRAGYRDGIISNSARSSRQSLPYTDWRSSALASRNEQSILREEDTDEEGQQPEAEYVQHRYFATDFSADRNSEQFDDGGKEQEFEEGASVQHNRTWPSIERMRERSKRVYMRSKQNETQSSYSSWTTEKRSIPLRPQNPISVGSSARIERVDSPNRLSSTSSRYQTVPSRSIDENRSKPSLANSLSRQSKSDVNAGHYYSDDDNVTIDTDILLTQPPMPIVDASPSLTSVSDDDTTIRDDSSETDSQSFADLPARPSSRVSFAPDVSFNQANPISPLSRLESTNPRTAGSHLVGKSVDKLKESSSQTFNKTSNEASMTRAELLDSFIDDCLQSSSLESYQRASPISRITASKSSIQEEPRTVEALKNMLINLNGIGPKDENPVYEGYGEDSGNTSEDAASVIGEESLERAYHHLERLKSLISSKVVS